MNRRKMLKFSLFASISAFAFKDFLSLSKNSEGIVTVYKIYVPDHFDFHSNFYGMRDIRNINIISALQLQNFDSSWAINYDNVKDTCSSDKTLVYNEKIFKAESKAIYITSQWKDLKSYFNFLNKANMSRFHQELKKNGHRPELKVFLSNGQSLTLPEFA